MDQSDPIWMKVTENRSRHEKQRIEEQLRHQATHNGSKKTLDVTVLIYVTGKLA